MATQQPELLPILKALREYITKEYGVNYPPHVRGEDASAKDVPSDWVDKLNPITGGETEGRAEYGSAGGNSTKGASQGEDPYIHKSELTQILEDFAKHVVDGQSMQTTGSRGDNAGMAYPSEGERIPQNRGLEMQDDEEEEDIDVEDAAAVSLRFDNGMIGSLHAGYFNSAGGETAVRLHGSQGWAKWNLADQACTISSDHPDWAAAPERHFHMPAAEYPGYGADGRALVKAFAAAIRGEGESGYRVDDAIRALQIIEAAHESAASGRTIDVA